MSDELIESALNDVVNAIQELDGSVYTQADEVVDVLHSLVAKVDDVATALHNIAMAIREHS